MDNIIEAARMLKEHCEGVSHCPDCIFYGGLGCIFAGANDSYCPPCDWELPEK